MTVGLDQHRPEHLHDPENQSIRVTTENRTVIASRALRLLEQLQTAVVICDHQLNIVYLNGAAQQLLNTSEQRAIGEGLATLLPLNDEFISNLREAFASGQPITTREVPIKLAPDEAVTTVDCIATPIEGEAELVIELSSIDRLKQLSRESAWQDAYEATRAVIRGVAHEVKNPLGGLRGAAQLLERQLDDESLHEYTNIIINEADRLRELVDRMGGPARPFTPEPINIHAVLEHVRSLLLAEAPAGVHIAQDYDPSLPEIEAEDQLLIQAFLNLVKNAIEAVGDSGVVTLRTRIERQVTIGQIRHRQAVRVDVIDTGPGVPAAIRDTLFYPLVTGRAEGTGLGLSISQDIISRHHGYMGFQSEPGETRFSIYLPVDEP